MTNDSHTRLFLSTPKPEASITLGKSHAFDGIRNFTATGRFTAWAGSNVYISTKANSHITAGHNISIIAGAASPPESGNTTDEQDNEVVEAELPAQLVPILPIINCTNDPAATAGFSMLATAELMSIAVELLYLPPVELYSKFLGYSKKKKTILGAIAPFAIPAYCLTFFTSGPFAQIEENLGKGSAEVEIYSRTGTKIRSKGGVEIQALGKVGIQGLLGASLTTPYKAKVAGGFSAALIGIRQAEVKSVFGSVNVEARCADIELTAFRGNVDVRGVNVQIGSQKDEHDISLPELATLNKAQTVFGLIARLNKKKHATQRVEIAAQQDVEVQAGRMDISLGTDDVDGIFRAHAKTIRGDADEHLILGAADTRLLMTEDSVFLMTGTNPARQALTEGRASANEIRAAGLHAAKKERQDEIHTKLNELDSLSTNQTYAGDCMNSHDAIAKLHELREEVLGQLEEADASSIEPLVDTGVASGLAVTDGLAMLVAGNTTVEVSNGSVIIRQCETGVPTESASITLENGSITLKAQKGISLDVGGTSYSFTPLGYTGPNLSELS